MKAPTDPSPIDYARPPEPSAWPQSEYGGVAAVLGVVTAGFAVMLLVLAMGFTLTGGVLLKWQAGFIGSLAVIGLVLAVCGLRQRARRRGAAVFALLINVSMLAMAGAVFLWV